MKILLDECVPLQVRHALGGHEVATAQKMGWGGISNGDLLDRAEQAGFQVLILADKNLRYQQNLAQRNIAILELWTNHRPTLEKYFTEIRAAMEKLSPGEHFILEIVRTVQRLGENHDGYHGERIDIRAVLRDVASAAQQHGWTQETFLVHGEFAWHALHRSARITQHASRLYISAGIHGDEPAAPLAALRLIQENRWPENVDIFLLPCLNPIGFTLNRRENADGIDLNRDYRSPRSAEARAHIAWLERQPRFDLYLCLHEDWEAHGFYLYEQNPDHRPSLAEKMIQAVQPLCPVDLSETIEGRPARGGIIRPVLNPQERPDWPEALYHITHKARQGYTLEAPSDFPLPTRVNALVAAVNAAANFLTTGGHG